MDIQFPPMPPPKLVPSDELVRQHRQAIANAFSTGVIKAFGELRALAHRLRLGSLPALAGELEATASKMENAMLEVVPLMAMDPIDFAKMERKNNEDS